MATQFPLANDPAREAVLRGIEKLSEAIKKTLGPSGGSTVLHEESGSPRRTRSGMMIAREFELEDPAEKVGAKFVREIADSTREMAGAGITTATVLAESIYKDGLRKVLAGADPNSLQRGIMKAVDAIAKELEKISKRVTNRAQIAQVATVAADWDETIGEIIAQAMDSVGRHGAIRVEKAHSVETSLKLAGAVAIIQIGGATEIEVDDKRARAEEALHATRAAVEEGIVPGGGVALLRAQQALDSLKNLKGDEKVGVGIVRRAIEAPCRQLVQNAGQKGSTVVANLKRRKGNIGYDVMAGEYVDLVEAGVVDATKVTRSALQNAASISNLLLQTERTIPEFREANLPSEISSRPITVGAPTDLPAPAAISDPLSVANGGGGTGDGGDGGDRADDGPRSDPPSRYLVAKTETTVNVGVPFILNAGIRTEDIPAGLGRGSSQVTGDVTGKLRIEIHAPEFVVNGATKKEIDVPPTGNSSWGAFELVATKDGLQTIDVLAFKNSALLGAVTISVAVGIEEPESKEVQNRMEARNPELGEYTLKIVFEKALQKYRFDLSSDTGETWEPVYDDEPLDEGQQNTYKNILTDLNIQARNLNNLSDYAQGKWLASMGSTLYKLFIPAKLKQVLSKNREKIRYLNILSKADPMPWELLYVADETGKGGFLGTTATVTRWRWGPPPGRQLSKKNPFFVLPRGSLAQVEEEVEHIRDKIGGDEDKVVRELDDLLKLLEAGNFSLLHFASHNVTDPGTNARLYIPFGNSKFDIQFMGQWTSTQFGAQRPLVFMNSCTSGGAVPLYKEMAGWADSFLNAGCGAFIGSLWEIRTTSARTFAEKFYDEAAAGKTLGESMRAARNELKLSDPTYLAYTLYGNPLAKLS